MLQDAPTPISSISVVVPLEDSLSSPRPRSVHVDNERDRIGGCRHIRTSQWCLDFLDSRISQYSKREESYTCWRVGEECLLASRRRCSSWIWRASGGYLVKQDHWCAPDGCVDERENFGTDRRYFTESDSHPALLRTRWFVLDFLHISFSSVLGS